jgi:hypothetical protein
MKTTTVNWITEKPKFEDVRGKKLLFIYGNNNNKFQDAVIANNFCHMDYGAYFGEPHTQILYAILTDEVEYCEWTRIKHAHDEFVYTNCMDGYDYHGNITDFKVCPFCTLPIKVISEIEPMELDGVAAKFAQEIDDSWYWTWKHNNSSYRSGKYATKREAIEAWNAFVGRMTK